MSCFWRHKWKAKKVDYIIPYFGKPNPNPEELKLRAQNTRVLYLCEACKQAKIEELGGKWTLEELQDAESHIR